MPSPPSHPTPEAAGHPHDAGPSGPGAAHRFLAWFAVLFYGVLALELAWRQYVSYTAIWPAFQAEMRQVQLGHAPAPWQYRIALPYLTLHLGSLLHLKAYQALVLLCLPLVLAGFWCLHRVLCQSGFVRGLAPSQAFAAVALQLAILQLPLPWLTAYPRPETLPTFFSLCALLFLFTSACEIALPLRYLLIVLLALGQGLVRADAAVIIGLSAVLLSCFATQQPDRGARRLWLFGGLLLVGIAGGLQLFLMKAVYPFAHYQYPGEAFQLWNNLTQARRIVDSGLALLFFVVGALLYLRARKRLDPSDRLAMLTAALFFPLWIIFGVAAEVRIFLPFLMLMAPTLAKVFTLRWLQAQS